MTICRKSIRLFRHHCLTLFLTFCRFCRILVCGVFFLKRVVNVRELTVISRVLNTTAGRNTYLAYLKGYLLSGETKKAGAVSVGVIH